MNLREVSRTPNLLSLSRVILAPVVVYFLWRTEPWATWAACGLVVLAGITDGLDGYLARRSRQITPLGVALDPIADKIFAAILVIGLILFREFPLWLTVLVVGRDLLIGAGGLYLMRKKPNLVLPSNLTGKWAFASLAVLLGAYIIRFNFSISLMTPVAAILLMTSLINYARVFLTVSRGRIAVPFHDTSTHRAIRLVLLTLVAVAHIVMFWVEFLG
jgi:CDP-diacylglycerol--glycerol-3-phosphate 3-phosphatidyltransferase